MTVGSVSLPISTIDGNVSAEKETTKTEIYDAIASTSLDDEEHLTLESLLAEMKRSVKLKCKWQKCSAEMSSIDSLYDHVLDVHINPNHGPKTEHVQCQWSDCEMAMTRGSLGKKVEWLEKHYRLKHAKNAKPFKCLIELCGFRATTLKSLEDHVHFSHFCDGPEMEERNDGEDDEQHSSLFAYKPAAIYSYRKPVSWYNLTDTNASWLVARNRLAEEMKNNVDYVVINRNRPRGSGKRKTGYTHAWRPQYQLVPGTTSEIREKYEESFDAKSESMITLEQLFPGSEEAARKRKSEGENGPESKRPRRPHREDLTDKIQIQEEELKLLPRILPSF